MRDNGSATPTVLPPLSSPATGVWWGLLGITAFSFTVPFTRIAVADGHLSALFVGSGRAVVAAALAATALLLTRQRAPRGTQWAQVAVVAGGAVVGFPLLTSFALTTAPASHGAVVIALLPAATAVVAVLRTGERPARSFWVAAASGAVAAVVFAAVQGGGFGGLHVADLLLFAAVIVCAIGYAEGGLLSRTLGSWQTISWGLVLASPLMVVLAGVAVVSQPPTGTAVEWGAFAYLCVVSMFLGFFAWYRGLAIGPMAQVSQVQLAQPVLSILLAGLLLREHIGGQTVAGGVAVIGCALLAVRARGRGRRAPGYVPDATGGDDVATGSLPGWLPLLNRAMRGLSRLGLAVGPVRVLTVPGRVSGEPRTTPVTPITVAGREFVVAALPEADWARNVRAAGTGTVAKGRRTRRVRIREVDDPALRADVLRAFPTEARGGVPFFVRLGLVDGPDPDQFAAVADRVAVFELSAG